MKEHQLKKILVAAKRGNDRAYDPFFKICYQTCRHRFQDNPDFDDTFMEVIIRFWEIFVKGDRTLPKNILGYVYRMTDYSLKNRAKRERNKVTIPLEPDVIDAVASGNNSNKEYNPVIQKENIDAQTRDRQLKLYALEAALEKMTDTCKAILIKTEIENVKLKELVEELGFSNYDSLKSKKSLCKRRWTSLAKKYYEQWKGKSDDPT